MAAKKAPVRKSASPELIRAVIERAPEFGDVDQLRRCPWYGELDLTLPHVSDRDVMELSAHTLGLCMAEKGVELLHIAVRLVDVEEFNASIARTDNKSETHFEAYSDIIGRLLARLPGDAHG